MTEFLTGLSNQPDFPRVDLNEDNADLLELMMANAEIVGQSHQAVERISWIFRVGHVTVLHSASRIHDDAERLAAVDSGIATFEAMTALIGGMAAVSDMTNVNRQSFQIRQADATELGEYMDSSLESFAAEMPRTAEVIRNSTRRMHGPLTNYAILGAAMSRQFELASVA